MKDIVINTGNTTLIDTEGHQVVGCPKDPCEFDPKNLCEALEQYCDCDDANTDSDGVYFCFIIEE